MNATLWDADYVLTNSTNITDCYFNCSNITANLESTEIIADYKEFMTNARFLVQRICMPVIYVLGIIGNIMSIIVLTQRRMRSSTNNYLTALATFDMLYLLFHFSLSLKHYPGYKHIIAPWYPIGVLLTDTSSNTSVWLTVSFTVERYIAVCHPMVGKRMCTRSRANIVIISVFAVCFAITLPVFFEWAVITVVDPKTNLSYYDVVHQDIAENPAITVFLYWYSAIIFIIIPLVALSVFNSFLIYSVHKSRTQRREMTMCTTTRSAKDPSSQETKITIMLIGVVVVFMLCQVPAACHLIYTSTFADYEDVALMNLLRGLGNIFNMMTAVNASVNFILYCCLSEKFRQTFIRTMCPCYRRVESPEHSVSNTAYTQMRDPDSCAVKKGDLSNSRSRSLSKSPHLQVRSVKEDGKRRESMASSSSHNEKSQNEDPQENHINSENKETLSLNTTPARQSTKGSYLTFDEKASPNSLNEAKKDTTVQACIRKDNKTKIHFLPETTLKLLRRNKREKRRKKSGQTPPVKNGNTDEKEIEEKVTTL